MLDAHPTQATGPSPRAPLSVDRPARLGPQYWACAAATLGSFVMGTCIGWSGPALALLSAPRDPWDGAAPFALSVAQKSWIASLMPLGALFGGLMAGYLIGVIGRHGTMLGTALAFALAYLSLAAAQSVLMLWVGRFLTGVATGLTSIAVPVYIAETSSPQVRGLLGSCFQVMVTLGVLFIDVVGAFGSWRWLSVACVAASLVWLICLCFVPESPTYLLAQRRFNEARLALQFLRGHEYVETELADLQERQESSANNVVSLRSLLSEGPYVKPLMISMMLMAGQQLSGVNAVLFFSVSIFEAAGTTLNSFLENVIVASAQFVATILAALFIDRLGRRPLAIFSALVMTISLYALGAYFWILSHDPDGAKAIGFLPLVSLCLFMFSFSVGFGPIPWLMMGELFGPETKEKASAISASFNWSLAFCVTQFYSPLANEVGTATTFWGFASFLVVLLIFSILFVPETKGRTLEEIQDLFRSNQDPSSRSRPLEPTDESPSAPLVLNADFLNEDVEHLGDHPEQSAVSHSTEPA
eukprot:maker-scaffold510_size151595-snap-gene-0.31 protein:Tk04750 transcript:maker-scaffold510_size151595-snap-gene-0.31-mRNA-1 annotation:"sugar transporter "